jgi:hypothetical protein
MQDKPAAQTVLRGEVEIAPDVRIQAHMIARPVEAIAHGFAERTPDVLLCAYVPHDPGAILKLDARMTHLRDIQITGRRFAAQRRNDQLRRNAKLLRMAFQPVSPAGKPEDGEQQSVSVCPDAQNVSAIHVIVRALPIAAQPFLQRAADNKEAPASSDFSAECANPNALTVWNEPDQNVLISVCH